MTELIRRQNVTGSTASTPSVTSTRATTPMSDAARTSSSCSSSTDVDDQYTQFKLQTAAACRIQRAWLRYRLVKSIRELKLHEPWFFEWSRFSQNDQLSVERLTQKLTSTVFLDTIASLMRMLGFQPECSTCNAKMLIIAFMLNHHAGDTIDNVLRKKIESLGTTFLQVCNFPHCTIRRCRFLDAYNSFYQSFVASKSVDASKMLSNLLSQMVDSLKIWHEIANRVNQGLLRPERCQRTLNNLHTRAKCLMDTLSCVAGSREMAMKLVKLELAKKNFMRKLATSEFANAADVKTCAKDQEDMTRQYRSVGVQLILDDKFESVHVGSREEKYDCPKENGSVMRTPHHLKLAYVKQLIRSNYALSNQELWVPSFINHVRLILNMIGTQVDIDVECVAQQCSLNCYDISTLALKLLHYIKAACVDSCCGHLEIASVTHGLKLIETECTSAGCSESVIFCMLDRLDDLRVAHMDHFFRHNKPKLMSMARKYELYFFIEDLKQSKACVKYLLQWSGKSVNNCQLLLDSALGPVGSAEWRLSKLKGYFSSFIASFPSHLHLREMPETFKLMRLTILRTLIATRDVVFGFSILHLAMGLSQDHSAALRLKKSIMAILMAEDAKLSQSEMVNKLCAAVEQERPCMSHNDKTIMRSLVTRLVRKSGGTIEGNTLEGVSKLALTRVRMAIQQRLLPKVVQTVPKLRYFETEVDRIAETAVRTWDLSFNIYRPIYETLLQCDQVWGETFEQSSSSSSTSPPSTNETYEIFESMETD